MEIGDSLFDDVLAAEDTADDPEPDPSPNDEDITDLEVTATHHVTESLPDEDAGEDMGDAAGPSAPLDLVRIDDIVGVPLLFQGNRHSPQVDRRFLSVLEATVRQTQARVPASYGKLLEIHDLGLFTPPPQSLKFHTSGRACDWQTLVFEHVRISPGDGDHAAASRAVRRRYWAFAAVCRSNSCFVLHGLFNPDHENHIHQDNGISQGFNTMESTVKLCQAILNDIFNQTPKLATDGGFGQKTQDAMTAAFQRLGIAGTVNDAQPWKKFLRMSARLGFHSAPPG